MWVAFLAWHWRLNSIMWKKKSIDFILPFLLPLACCSVRKGDSLITWVLCVHLSTSFLSLSNPTVLHNIIKSEACGWVSQSSHSNVRPNIKLLTYEKEQIKQGNPILIKMKETGSGVWGWKLGRRLHGKSAWKEKGFNNVNTGQIFGTSWM